MKKYFEIFGEEKGLKLGLQRTKTVEKMIGFQKVEIMKVHYDNYIKSEKKKRNQVIIDDDIDEIEEKLWIEIVSTIRKLIALARRRNTELYNKCEAAIDKKDGRKTEKPGKIYIDAKKNDDFDKLGKQIDIATKPAKQNRIEPQDIMFDILVDSNDLFTLTTEKDKVKIKINFEHALFDVKGSINKEEVDEYILKTVLVGLARIKARFITFDERLLIDRMIKELNSEINKAMEEVK